MRIYTRTGDDGSTGLFGGARIGKDDLRIEAYGTIDELNAWIGKIATHDAAEPLRSPLQAIQSELFTLGSHLATTDPQWAAKLPALNPQVPKDSSLGWTNLNRACLRSPASCCLAGIPPPRTPMWRAPCVAGAERRCVSLHRETKLDPVGLTYLNRLSDALFMVGRWLTHATGNHDIPWKPND